MNTILQRCFKERRTDMSPMKAQKLLFFTNGWHLAVTGGPAIDSMFETWLYGPLVADIYHSLKKFGSSSVTEYIKENDQEKSFVVSPQCVDIMDSIDIVWEKYIGIRAVNLSTMTHEPGSPWDIARRSGKIFIPNDLIKDYFVNLARK